jgi:hypothetical protein
MNAPELPLEDKLRAWLGTHGYPLEMRVARALQLTGADVVQSDYYTDSTTSREIDVVASWQDEIDRILVRVSLTFECKSSRDKPWVLFVSPDTRLTSPARVAQRAASSRAGIALWDLADQRALQELPIFQLPAAPAYGLKQAFSDKADVCYAAIAGVAAAAAAQADQPDLQDPPPGRYDIFEVIFPVVVTDARLYAALLKADGELDLKEQKTGVLLWRNPVLNRPHTIIHVVSSPALAESAEMARKSAESFLAMCRGELRLN